MEAILGFLIHFCVGRVISRCRDARIKNCVTATTRKFIHKIKVFKTRYNVWVFGNTIAKFIKARQTVFCLKCDTLS